MPLIQHETSVAANSTVDNVLSGSAWEYLPYNAALEFGLVASATGLVVTLISGSDLIMEESPISIQNRFPIKPDDFVARDVARAGEKLIVRVRNTTAGALTLFSSVDVTPV